MKRFYTSAAAVLLSASVAQADALAERDLCASGSTDDNGNWYCQRVNAVTYTGIGVSGSYNQITDMPSSGSCASSAKSYSGTLAPFDEEVSLHFRGPMQLKQLAVYTPSGSVSSRDAPIEKRDADMHAHANAHAHAHAHEKREPAVGDWVTATMDGQVVSWQNEYSGQPTPAVKPNNVAQYAAPEVTTTAAAAAQETAAQTASGSSSSGSSYGSSHSSSAWTRQGYYSSANGTSQGLTFLNHNGGSGSGVFDYTYGNSLSYASANGLSGSASPQVLADTTLPSSAEVVVMTDKKCSGTDCGFVRPGTVAYHGFEGAEKIFLMEFGMPISGEKAASIYDPVDMSAIWMLNAQIPRTLQYGQADCSCWTSGCGEFDIFEVLAPGDTRCKSTIHGNAQGGDSDYFQRPTTGTAKAAIVMSNNQFHIKMLDDSTSFDAALDSSFVSTIMSTTATQNGLVSLFALSS